MAPWFHSSQSCNRSKRTKNLFSRTKRKMETELEGGDMMLNMGSVCVCERGTDSWVWNWGFCVREREIFHVCVWEREREIWFKGLLENGLWCELYVWAERTRAKMVLFASIFFIYLALLYFCLLLFVREIACFGKIFEFEFGSQCWGKLLNLSY